MSDKFSFRGGDPEGVPDGNYALTVSGGHVIGLSATDGAAQAESQVREALEATAGDQRLTLGAMPVPGSPFIWVNGALFWPGAGYSITDDTIQFDAPLSTGDSVWVSYETTGANPSASTLAPITTPSYSAAVLADSPVIYWKLDETSGSTVADSSGNGHAAAHSGAVTVNQPSLLGDGSGRSATYAGGYTGIAWGPWGELPQLTIEARYKPDANALSGTKPIASAWFGSGTARWLLWLNGGKLEAYIYSSTGANWNATGTTTLVAGTSYTVGMTYDGTSLKVIVNGIREAETVANAAISTTGSPGALELARVSQATIGSGGIDEFSLTATALSETRMLARHQSAIAA